MQKNKHFSMKEDNFENSFRFSVGNKFYKKLSKDEREIIHEMSECQRKGGAINSAPIINPT